MGIFEQEIINAFQSLLTDPSDWRANIEGLDFSRLDKEATTRLEAPFSKEEVALALKEMNVEKATSPDSYTSAF